jgi:hypothetical protein
MFELVVDKIKQSLRCIHCMKVWRKNIHSGASLVQLLKMS